MVTLPSIIARDIMSKVDNYIQYLNAFYAWESQHRLTHIQQCIMLRILHKFNQSRWQEWIKIPNWELMLELGINREATFRSNRDRLIDLGLIKFVRGKSTQKPSSYKLNMPVKKETIWIFENEKRKKQRGTKINGDGKRRESKMHVDRVVVTDVVTDVVTPSKPAKNQEFQSTLKNKKENNKHNTPLSNKLDIPPKGEGTPKKISNSKKDLENDPLFVEFWNAYPNKKNKPSAVRAYGKIKPMSHEVMEKIISGIERYKNSGYWDKKQFIPHPATFLNNRKWEDEVENLSEGVNRDGKASYNIDEYEKYWENELISSSKGGERSDAWKRAWDRQYHYEDGTCTRYSEGD